MPIRGFAERGLGLVVVAVALVALHGCDTGQAGARNVAGTVVAYVDATPQQVNDASKAVVKKLGLILISSKATTLDASTVARTAADRKISIDVESQAENVSKISIRAGVLGDESLSLKVLKEIQMKLPKNPG